MTPSEETFSDAHFDNVSSLSPEIRGRCSDAFLEYIIGGQFPELISIDDAILRKRYLQESVLNKSLEYDLPRLFRLERPEELKHIFNVLVFESGNLLEYQNLASDTEISLPTVRHYIDILRQGFLSLTLLNHTGSVRKTARQLKKGYVTSSNFCAVMGGHTRDNVPPEVLGHIVETYAANILSRRFQNIFFWKHRKREIDFLAVERPDCYLIECKFKRKIVKEDGEMLLYSPPVRTKGRIRRIMLTPDVLRKIEISASENLILMPLWSVC